MNILICDDDRDDIEMLKDLLLAYDSEKNIGMKVLSYEDGASLLNAIETVEPNAIFLDINMDKMDGLMLAGKIRENYGEVPIVLVTAFINYALEGYKVRASRFLLKDDLKKTFPECMDHIISRMVHKRERMNFSCVEGEVNLKLADILYIEVSGHKSTIFLKGECYHIYETMEDIEKRLKPYDFLRVHQSYLVNLKHIRKIKNYNLTLDTGQEITIPKSRYKQVKQDYMLYVGKEL